jgi:hypothetical protein
MIMKLLTYFCFLISIFGAIICNALNDETALYYFLISALSNAVYYLSAKIDELDIKK